MIEAILFDLDDTLYSEKEFVVSGYKTVARKVAATNGCDFTAAFEYMMYSLQTAGRRTVFSDLLAYFPTIPFTINDLVWTYREHIPIIELMPGYRKLLQQLRKNYRLGIITDGLPVTQRNKVSALGIEGLFDRIIYSWDYGQEREKPHPHSFTLMAEFFRLPPKSMLFIGDNTEKDGRGAEGAGMKYIRVMSPPDETIPCADGEKIIGNLLQLPQVLKILKNDK